MSAPHQHYVSIVLVHQYQVSTMSASITSALCQHHSSTVSASCYYHISTTSTPHYHCVTIVSVPCQQSYGPIQHHVSTMSALVIEKQVMKTDICYCYRCTFLKCIFKLQSPPSQGTTCQKQPHSTPLEGLPVLRYNLCEETTIPLSIQR